MLKNKNTYFKMPSELVLKKTVSETFSMGLGFFITYFIFKTYFSGECPSFPTGLQEWSPYIAFVVTFFVGKVWWKQREEEHGKIKKYL